MALGVAARGHRLAGSPCRGRVRRLVEEPAEFRDLIGCHPGSGGDDLVYALIVAGLGEIGGQLGSVGVRVPAGSGGFPAGRVTDPGIVGRRRCPFEGRSRMPVALCSRFGPYGRGFRLMRSGYRMPSRVARI